MLIKEQQVQENEYFLPYHWAEKKDTFGGRTYFGYMEICHSFLPENISNMKILDAGCGDGRFLGELAVRGAKKIYGFDYSPRAVSFAKIFLPEADLKVVDVTDDLAYGDEFFDRIFSVEVFEHIEPEKVDKAVGNLKRILKTNGELILTIPSNKTEPPPKHFQHFNETKIRKIFGNHFEIVDVVGQGKISFSFLELFYKFLDNRFWTIRPLAKFYNEKIWPKYFNKCPAEKGERLIVRCKKL